MSKKNKKHKFGVVKDGREKVIQDFLTGKDVSNGARTAVLGQNIDEQTALSITAFYSCVTTIAETISTTPLKLKRDDGRKKRDADDVLEYYLFTHEPNPNCTPAQFLETFMMSSVMHGNGYANQVRREDGRVTELWNIEPEEIRGIYRNNRAVFYKYSANGQAAPYAKNTEKVFFQGEDALHFKRFSRNGVTGSSVLGLHKERLGLALAEEEFQTHLYDSGVMAKGVLETNENLDDDSFERLRAQFAESYSGVQKNGSVIILPIGHAFKAVQMNPRDAEFIAQTKLTEKAIAQLFKVPLYKLQNHDHSTFSNVEHLSIEFVQSCIRPWAVAFEQCLNQQILTRNQRYQGLRFMFNLDALERGAKMERYNGYTAAINSGWMLRSDAREIEDFNEVEGLDEPLIPMNMATLAEKKASLEAVRKVIEPPAKEDPKQVKASALNALVELFSDAVRRYGVKLEAGIKAGKPIEEAITANGAYLKNQVSKIGGFICNLDDIPVLVEKWARKDLESLPVVAKEYALNKLKEQE